MTHNVINLGIGAGLFASEAVPVEIEFPQGTATFMLNPFTQETILDLKKSGVNLDAKNTNQRELLKGLKKTLELIVEGWEGLQDENGMEIPYSPENRDKVAGATPLALELIRVCSELAVKQVQDTEKN